MSAKMSLVAALYVLGILAVLTKAGHESDVKCFTCANIQSPELCLAEEFCNLDEVCFTREIEDHNGIRAFRMGCERRDICDSLAPTTEVVLGRRGDQGLGSEVKDKRQTTLCFRCCSSDSCNNQLCMDVVGLPFNGTHSAGPGHYTVTVSTGDYEDHDNDFLGTRGDVYVTLYGTAGNSGPIQLQYPDGSRAFDQGSVDQFDIKTPTSLGKLTKIRVQLKGRDDDGWFLKKIEVENTDKHETSTFTFYSYLESDAHGHQTDRTVCADGV